MKHSIRNILMGGLFLLLITGLGIAGDLQTASWYIFDPELNEAFTADAGDEHESAYLANFPGKDAFIDGNGLMAGILGQREMNGVIKLNNGYLTDVRPQLSREKLREEAETVIHVSDVLKQHGIPFLYVAAPMKPADGAGCTAQEQLPAGVEDYGNENLDFFLSCLSEGNEVNILDLRQAMNEDGRDPYEFFYRTDHHWTTEGAFYAYQKLAAWIKALTGTEPEQQVSDSEQYNRTVYKGWHMGSNARRTGTLYAGLDDFVLITPKFETKLTNRVSGQTGSFEEVLLNMEAVEEKDLDYSLYDRLYLHALEQYHNELCSNGLKILLICDSYGAALNPYLVLSCEDTECMSAYAPGLLTESYLEQQQPDLVILMQYSGLNLGEDSSFEFGL